MTEYNGSKNNADVNPVVSLLSTYKTMSKNDILTHIRDWWFDADATKLFDDSIQNNIIVKKDRMWTLSQKESVCPKCGEQVTLVGPHSVPDLDKKKKKKFEFIEALDDTWREIEHYLMEDATNSGQKSDTVGNPEFRSFTHSSSFVGNVLWDRESSEMDIILNGKTYHFCRVSERLFDAFEGANSKGEFFNREIKTLHDC